MLTTLPEPAASTASTRRSFGPPISSSRPPRSARSGPRTDTARPDAVGEPRRRNSRTSTAPRPFKVIEIAGPKSSFAYRARRAAHEVGAQHLPRLGGIAQSCRVDERGPVEVARGLVEHVTEPDPDPEVEARVTVSEAVDRGLEHGRVLEGLACRREGRDQAITLPSDDLTSRRVDQVGGDRVVRFAQRREVQLAQACAEGRRTDDVAEDHGHGGLPPRGL